MKQKTDSQPNFRLFRALRSLRGLDNLHALRGLERIEFWDFDIWMSQKTKKVVRDFTFRMDVNNAVQRDKTAQAEYHSRLRNLAPISRHFEPTEQDWLTLEQIIQGSRPQETTTPFMANPETIVINGNGNNDEDPDGDLDESPGSEPDVNRNRLRRGGDIEGTPDTHSDDSHNTSDDDSDGGENGRSQRGAPGITRSYGNSSQATAPVPGSYLHALLEAGDDHVVDLTTDDDDDDDDRTERQQNSDRGLSPVVPDYLPLNEEPGASSDVKVESPPPFETGMLARDQVISHRSRLSPNNPEGSLFVDNQDDILEQRAPYTFKKERKSGSISRSASLLPPIPPFRSIREESNLFVSPTPYDRAVALSDQPSRRGSTREKTPSNDSVNAIDLTEDDAESCQEQNVKRGREQEGVDVSLKDSEFEGRPLKRSRPTGLGDG